jgi:hypothetical protein
MTRDDGRRDDPSLLPLVHASPKPEISEHTNSGANPALDAVPSVLPLVHAEKPSAKAPEVPSLVPDASPTSGQSASDREPAAAEQPAAAAEPHADPLAPLATAVSGGDWPAVLESLGSPQSAASLPSQLALLYAIARKEAQLHVSEADRDQEDPTQVAIRAMAALLGVPETSPVALVLAKRLLRSNPVSWRKRKAPPVGTSMLIIVAGVLVGLAAGYVISVGYVQIRLPGLG